MTTIKFTINTIIYSSLETFSRLGILLIWCFNSMSVAEVENSVGSQQHLKGSASAHPEVETCSK